jgi:hypothetical protein
MKVSDVPRQKDNKQFYQSIFRFLVGGALGGLAYILIAQAVVNQTELRCYQTPLIRSLVEASLFLAPPFAPLIVHPESIYYQRVLYGLASTPYALLGALIALRVNKLIILVVGLVISFCLCLSVAFYVFIFMAQLCA